MQQAHSTSLGARLSQRFAPRLPAPSRRGAAAALALALLIGVAGVALALSWPVFGTGREDMPTAAAPAAPAHASASDYGTEFDPFVIQGSQRRYVPLAPAPDYASDLGTEFDPFVIQGSQRQYAPLAPAQDTASDYGTDYDPFVIGSSRPRYAGSGPGATDDGGPCREPGRSCNR